MEKSKAEKLKKQLGSFENGYGIKVFDSIVIKIYNEDNDWQLIVNEPKGDYYDRLKEVKYMVAFANAKKLELEITAFYSKPYYCLR